MIVGLDPGGTTGVAIYNAHLNTWDFEQLDKANHHTALWSLLDGARADAFLADEPLTIVCESFEFRHDMERNKIVYDSAEYIGVVKLFCDDFDAKLVMQSASVAKQFWTDDKLKKVNLYRPAMRHAMDALRHVLYYRAFTLKDKTLLKELK